MTDRRFVVIGAGPAGLAATYELARKGLPTICLEKDSIVGGLSRTVVYNGYRFDIGGHRFFTKITEVDDLWREVLGDDFLRRPRLSRIYYNNRFFNYPLKPMQALRGLGPIEAGRILLSYASAKMHPHDSEESFEQWVTKRFGNRLFSIFFKTYTEKVWGIPCSEISAQWASQRIKGLSLSSAILNGLFKHGSKGSIKTLIEEFDYPRLGPGQMYETMADKAIALGAQIVRERPVVALKREGNRVGSVVIKSSDTDFEEVDGTDFVSTMPITDLVLSMDPPAPPEVLDAAKSLSYRSILTVNLLIDQQDMFPDTWIYVHSPEVRVGRIQCYKNWSPYMVPDQSKSSLGLEYFATEGDDLWIMNDADLIALAKQEITSLGLCREDRIIDGFVVRMAKAYPVYDAAYTQRFGYIKQWVASIENLQPSGRYGLFRYNNSDHSILSAMYAVRTLLGEKGFDVWQVNTEDDYHEEHSNH